MLNLCYKERNKLWPKGSFLGILQGHRPNTASQVALKDLFHMKYCSPSEKIKLCSNWNVRTTLTLKKEHLSRLIQLLGFELEMLTAFYHRTPKMTQLQLIQQLLWYSWPVVYSSLVRTSLSATCWPSISCWCQLQITPANLSNCSNFSPRRSQFTSLTLFIGC